jgi:hypothetical protein
MENYIESFKKTKEGLFNDITGFINICIRNILTNANKKDIIFKTEVEFQYNLAFELKNMFKRIDVDDIQIYLEYNMLNYYFEMDITIDNYKTKASEYGVLDIVIEFDKSYYIIELKYGDTDGTVGTSLSESINRFTEDKNRIQNLVNKYKNIHCGYCILLTISDSKRYCKKIDTLDVNKWINVGKFSYYIEEIKRK